jgi:hypothetical protein
MKEKILKFKEKGLIKHDGKYDYSLVFFNNIKDSIKIICPEHGLFEQRVDIHLKGEGCKKCYLTKRGVGGRLNNNDFILKAKLIHGDTYNYSNTLYIKNNEYLTINCLIHGEFKQLAQSHLNGSGCPICKESKGEREIRKYLTVNQIKYIRQHKFIDCRDIRPLPFDFYLPDNNICIEYHGIQHYEPVKYFGGDERFIIQQKRDNIKKEYCQNNNIRLIIIKFNEEFNKQLQLT